ncbi:Stage II sporulation protein D (SpoIID) [hydrothermal vent metagenome]|uniref:Stage II sporulation protein D (SpoIID) n=1 Tax=hydrothermal vent metagenome TaxID=652676 RepID=A0A3B0S1U6_9ZZZZ
MNCRPVAVVVAVVTIVTAVGVGVAGPAVAGPVVDKQVQTIELVAIDDARFIFDGRPYTGPIRLTIYDDGIAVTEIVSMTTYLEGIAEMPFSWAGEALKAQAVAARTYLARRLLPGRRGDAASHEYDICATNRCQVYRGVQLIEGSGGDRWREAIRSTDGEVLLYEGRPIEAVFTSMVGSRSRANQDVWSSDPLPYLQAVDSPEIGVAPYAQWQVEITTRQFVEILRADGFDVGGALLSMTVDDPPEGLGRTNITVETEHGTISILAPALKGVFSRRGDELYPGALPARLGDGRKLPEPLLSYTYEITLESQPGSAVDPLLPQSDRSGRDSIVFDGEGWGHGVGMSQWGARIMADNGDSYDQILSHYYSGLTPQQAPDVVPDDVVVGLATDLPGVSVEVDGRAVVLVNGVPAGLVGSGSWIVRDTSGGLDLLPIDGAAPSPITRRVWPR